MTQKFTDQDRQFMQVALDEAALAAQDGNYPVGAVLVVNGNIIAQERNRKENKDRISHAEMLLFLRHSGQLYEWERKEGARIELFTTFEPCLMCLGVAVIHRVHRIVVACRDPRGDMSSIKPDCLGAWYQRHWPLIEHGLCFEISHRLLTDFFCSQADWEMREAAQLFLDMKAVD